MRVPQLLIKLGLSGIQGRAQIFNGNIVVKSRLGEGTIITVELLR